MNHDGTLAGAVFAAALAGLIAGGGCAGPPTERGRRVIDVLCKGDALAQPIIIPVVVVVSPAAGAVAPAIAGAAALDVALIHPAVVRACAEYMSKPDAVVAEPPVGALVATPVVVTVPAVRP